jgi:hypothetical protein
LENVRPVGGGTRWEKIRVFVGCKPVMMMIPITHVVTPIAQTTILEEMQTNEVVHSNNG